MPILEWCQGGLSRGARILWRWNIGVNTFCCRAKHSERHALIHCRTLFFQLAKYHIALGFCFWRHLVGRAGASGARHERSQGRRQRSQGRYKRSQGGNAPLPGKSGRLQTLRQLLICLGELGLNRFMEDARGLKIALWRFVLI